ncbi:MarR family transcriptional regulator [Arthrobacter sp. CAU 1506]|uniref:MarR family winged helix-turn-helix transcriptional regulator n=1 Tax=Arthrobacter sp. CAU 1506 TaxID=2560052 RepID=UPI00197AE3B4|nr:MarR family transcriptional regulator [Arthrobacter sp. CAU 1506]
MADDNLLDAFWAVSRQLRKATRQGMDPLGVAPSQARALRMLRHHGSLRLGELSERLRIAPRSATEIVDGLQERGWCVREPDPTDRRATVVVLTEAGQDIGRTIRKVQVKHAEEYFAALSAAERSELSALLGKLTAAEG